jgi:phosphohistidine phosphatase
MRRLHLLRHAKSSWKEDVEDHRRGLSRRGREAARRVGEHLPAAVGSLDLVLASSARRTCQTLDLVLAQFTARPRISIEDELYLASAERLLGRLRRLAEEDHDVLVIGHNPGLRELALLLADAAAPASLPLVSGKFPTAVRVSFQIATPWPELGRSRLTPTDYVTVDTLPGGKG